MINISSLNIDNSNKLIFNEQKAEVLEKDRVDVENFERTGKLWSRISIDEQEEEIHQYSFNYSGKNQSVNSSLIQAITRQIFPAIEPLPENFLWLNSNFGQQQERLFKKNLLLQNSLNSPSGYEENREKFQIARQRLIREALVRPLLNQLGFNCFYNREKQLILELPTQEALNNRWCRLQQARPDLELPNIRIVSSEGVASDRSFIEAYRDATVLISNDEEAFHDLSTHVLRTLSLIIQTQTMKRDYSYQEIKEKMVSFINDSLKTIDVANETIDERDPLRNALNLMEPALAIIIDYITTSHDSNYLNDFLTHQFSELFREITIKIPLWIEYLSRRGQIINQTAELINVEDLIRDWEEIFQRCSRS